MMFELILPDWIFQLSHACVIIVFIIGLLCFFLRKEFVRQILGLKLMLQSISLGLITTGLQRSDFNSPQSMVISALVVEAIVIGLALTMIIRMTKYPKNDRQFFAHFSQKGKTHDG